MNIFSDVTPISKFVAVFSYETIKEVHNIGFIKKPMHLAFLVGVWREKKSTI